MNKHYCPYCGERTLSTSQKFMGKEYNIGFGKLSNKIWFSCPNCHNEVDKRITEKGVKKSQWVVLLIFALFLLFLLFVALDLVWIGLIAFCFAAVLIFYFCAISAKHDIFVRKPGKYNDTIVSASLFLSEKAEIHNHGIYFLGASDRLWSKRSAGGEYLIEISEYDKASQKCNIRFIKPKDPQIQFSNFLLYAEGYNIGKGTIIKG